MSIKTIFWKMIKYYISAANTTIRITKKRNLKILIQMLIAILGLVALIISAIALYFWKKHQNDKAMRAAMDIF